MNIMVTVKSIHEGRFKVEIRRSISEVSYQEFTAEQLQQYLLNTESYCERHGGRLIWNVPSEIRKMAFQWMEGLLE